MTTVIRMPQFTETMVEGVVGKWLKKEGEWVRKEEPLVEIVTDKVVVEMPSPLEGRLLQIVVPENRVVAVGGEIAVLEGAGEGASTTTDAQETKVRGSVAAVRSAEAPSEEAQRYSPVVKRLAQEHAVDLKQIRGSGLGGRVTREDVMAHVAHLGQTPQIHPSPASSGADEEKIPITPVRRFIAEHMVRSVQTAPHAWAAIETDVTNLVNLREGLKEAFQGKHGAPITYLPFVIKAATEALRENPLLNSTWTEDYIVVKKSFHIGFSVATEDGVVVPVIKDADKKSITQLALEVAHLTSKAMERRLTLADVQGGTFTINNTGVLGTILTMSIINQPQAAILNTEAIVKRPVVVGDSIVIRSMMNLSISIDHRVLDGAAALRFLAKVKGLLQGYDAGTPIS